MGLNWHLGEVLAEQGLSWEDLDAQLSFPLSEAHRGAQPPDALSMADLAEITQALGVQPGELLSFTPETPEEQAERALARNQFYQSFLAYRQQAEGE
jgi:DNA-binding Xre family transcriptional regulator